MMMPLNASVGQKPKRVNRRGKRRNIGNVGTTYHKVYQAWLVIFEAGCFSIYSQVSASSVTKGNEASNAPSPTVCAGEPDSGDFGLRHIQHRATNIKSCSIVSRS